MDSESVGTPGAAGGDQPAPAGNSEAGGPETPPHANTFDDSGGAAPSSLDSTHPDSQPGVSSCAQEASGSNNQMQSQGTEDNQHSLPLSPSYSRAVLGAPGLPDIILGLPHGGSCSSPSPVPVPASSPIRRSLRLQGLSPPRPPTQTLGAATTGWHTFLTPTILACLQEIVKGEKGDKKADIPTPETWQEALSGDQASEWLESMVKELNGLKAAGTFRGVPRKDAANVLTSKWVFKIKRRKDGTPLFKSRLVIGGHKQKFGIDFFDTFAPTAKHVTVRFLLHLAAVLGFHVRVLDVDQAFVHGELEETIHMEPPAGLQGINFSAGDEVWRLQKPLYGLKEAPRQWHAKLKAVLGQLGYTPAHGDSSLFIKQGEKGEWVLVYVDDMLLVSPSEDMLSNLKTQLEEHFHVKDLGVVTQYLGMQVTRDGDKKEFYLSQERYVHELLKRFGQEDCKLYSTPLQVNHTLSPAKEGDAQHPDRDRYPELIGGLMYLMVCTRPDIAHTVSVLSRYVAPGRHAAAHWDAALRLLGYLKGTAHYKLVLGGTGTQLTGYSDSSWADDKEDRKSSQGHCFTLGTGVISWKATRSFAVALSTCEAELYAACSAAQEAMWLAELLSLLGCPQDPAPILWCDNQSTVALTKDPMYTGRSKHIEARYYFIRELVQAGRLRTAHIPGVNNVADIFTKPLSHEDHARLTRLLGLREV